MTEFARNAAGSGSRFGFILVLAAAIAFAGCAEWRSVKRTLKEPEGDVMYALATVPLRAKPSASAKVKGTLALHEKVIRLRFESGYVLVAVGGGALEGWVENAKLSRQNPAARAPIAESP